jgi:hypothetical protein
MINTYIALNRILILLGIIIIISCCPLKAQTGDSTSFRYYYFINSNPFNAEVFYKDSLLGLTPVRFATSDKLSGKIILRKKGYREETVNLDDYNFDKGVEVLLKPAIADEERIVLKNYGTSFVKKRSLTGILTSGIVAIASGTIAYTAKEKANDLYNTYIVTRNQNDLNKVNRYDLYSGISLALMQVSVAALIYFLFLQ